MTEMKQAEDSPESHGTRVRVAVRLRPFNAREIALASSPCVRMEDTQTTITHPTTGAETTFTFDHCFWSGGDDENNGTEEDTPKHATQQSVFDEVGHSVLESACSGYNVCLFAYGQTGSGKSHSMVGPTNATREDEGIVVRVCREIFSRLQASKQNTGWSVSVTMIEIYDEKVYDLLLSDANASSDEKRPSMKVRQHPITGPYVEGLAPTAVTCYDEIKNLMAVGEKNRTIAATAMNETSSRAHTVFELNLDRVSVDPKDSQKLVSQKSRISLVDLAGSERVDGTGATGQRLKEAGAINKSLSALGNVIAALAEKSEVAKNGKQKNAEKLVPYRDSSLTLLLKDCLGGNSHCVMVAALSPAAVNFEETLSTLRFADRARNIVSSASVNRQSAIPKQIRIHAEAVDLLRDALPDDLQKIDPALERALEKAITLTEEANEICDEFDVDVEFKPTLVDAQSALLRIRKKNELDVSSSNSVDSDGAHALECAIDVSWRDTDRKTMWPVSSLHSRVIDWRNVREEWKEGVLFSSEAREFIRNSTKQEVTSEMRKLGTAALSTEPLAYLLDTETMYPAIVGTDGSRKGTLEVSAVPCGKDGTPLGESDAQHVTNDPQSLLGKPLYFLVRIKRATGLPRTVVGSPDDTDVAWNKDSKDSSIQGANEPNPINAAPRPQTGQVTATLRVRYHGDLGPGWGTTHATPPMPVVAVHESKGSARFRGFKGASGGGTTSGAAAVLRYERTHSCPVVTTDTLKKLRTGVITFDVYLQHDGGAGAGAESVSSINANRPSTADITRLRRKALTSEPPSLLPPKRSPSPVAEETAEPIENSDDDNSQVSDSQMLSRDDASDVSSGSSRNSDGDDSYEAETTDRSVSESDEASPNSGASHEQEGSFDQEAYETYWDETVKKHAAAMRSPFKMFPGWGAVVSPAPSPAGQLVGKESGKRNSRVAVTHELTHNDETDDVLFLDSDIEATTLDALAGRLEAQIAVASISTSNPFDETPTHSPAPASNPNKETRGSRFLASPLKSPLHKGKIGMDGVVAVREVKTVKQPRALAGDAER